MDGELIGRCPLGGALGVQPAVHGAWGGMQRVITVGSGEVGRKGHVEGEMEDVVGIRLR